MKVFLLVFTLIFSFVSCSTSETSLSSSDLLSPKKNVYNPADSILEITSDYEGPWWMNGKVLDFRLYKDRTVEYDSYPLQSGGKTLKAEEVKVTQQIKISESEFNEIINTLTSDKFLKLNEEITQEKSCIDALKHTEIIYNHEGGRKNIRIINCATLSDLESTSFYFKNFPQSLTRLFQQIRKALSKDWEAKFPTKYPN